VPVPRERLMHRAGRQRQMLASQVPAAGAVGVGRGDRITVARSRDHLACCCCCAPSRMTCRPTLCAHHSETGLDRREHRLTAAAVQYDDSREAATISIRPAW